MALQISKELASGADATYVKIAEVKLDMRSLTAHVSVSFYKDADARHSGKVPMDEKSYSFSGVDNPCTLTAMNVADSNPIKLSYAKLKTLDEFSGAVDY